MEAVRDSMRVTRGSPAILRLQRHGIELEKGDCQAQVRVEAG